MTAPAATRVDVTALYERFFELGGPPPGNKRPWQWRRRCTSLRLGGALFLAEAVRRRRPRRVLDLGSGLTTHVLRSLMAEFPQMEVVTTDTSPMWLACTARELARDGLNEEHCFVHAGFEARERGLFDLISVDIGSCQFRVENAAQFASWLATGGLMVLDDWHMKPYPEFMGAALAALGLAVTPHPETEDDGFLATAERLP